MIRRAKNERKDKVTKLGDVEPGALCRWASISFEDALASENPADHFFYVYRDPKESKEREHVTIVSADHKQGLRRDPDRLVVVHEYDLVIQEAIKVKA